MAAPSSIITSFILLSLKERPTNEFYKIEITFR